jgi:hypothetical protein
MKKLALGLAALAAAVACCTGSAWAGCCLTGAHQLEDHSGYVIIDTGAGACLWHFDHCDVSVYTYEPCEEGPSTVVSFRVHPGANCNFYPAVCYYATDCGYVATSTGNAYECTKSCE